MLLRAQDCIVVMIDHQEKLMPSMMNVQQVLANSLAILKATDLFKIPVITTEHYPDKIGKTISDLYAYRGEVIEKKTFSAAKEHGFIQKLAEISQHTKRTHLLFIGCETHVCVLQSLLGIHEQNHYQCYLVVDACGSRKSIDKEMALRRASQAGVTLLSTEMVLFEWLESGDNPFFKPIIQDIKQLT